MPPLALYLPVRDKVDWKHYLFGFEGRINRAKYWLYIPISFGAQSTAFLILAPFPKPFGTPHIAEPTTLPELITWILIIAFVALGIWIGLAVQIKRLHDRDKSGWWVFLFGWQPIVPIVGEPIISIGGDGGLAFPASHYVHLDLGAFGPLLALALLIVAIWAFIELYCLPGTEGPNRFGPDPLPGVSSPAGLPA